MDTFLDESLVQEFVTESKEHLDAIEPDLLVLESAGDEGAREVIHRVFRAIHSIKGGAGFLAYDTLKHLSHNMESVLMRIRDGELAVNAAIADTLLRSVDRLREMVEDIADSDSVVCDRELAELQQILRGEAPAADAEAPVTPAAAETPLDAFDWECDALRAAARRSTPLYRITIDPAVGMAAESPAAFTENLNALGEPFLPKGVESLDAGLAAAQPFGILFSTVLEEDLAASALELPAAQVRPARTADLAPFVGATNGAVHEAAEVPADSAATGAAGDRAPAKGAVKDQGAETLRVRVDLLSRMMNTTGELVLARNQLMKAFAAVAESNPQLLAVLQNMDRVTGALQEEVMQTRLQPIGAVFGKFPRVVRDIAKRLGKQIEVDLHGGDVEVDKSVIELIGDPLTHIVRNCADHAIEGTAERAEAGKSTTGRIRLSAFHEGGQVLVTIEDDGRGIDPEKIKRVAIKRGILQEEQARRMTDRDLVNLIFAPGFSTAEEVTDLSGRGVGMDVVRTNIEKLGGAVDVDSTLGTGTLVTLQIPLTLAIVPSLIVGVEDQQFAIPQMSVEEIVWVRAADVRDRIEHVNGRDILHLRERLLPLLPLAEVLGMPRTYIDPESGERRPDRRKRVTDRRAHESAQHKGRPRGADRRTHWQTDYKVVVVKAGRAQYGIIVDRLFDSEDIVMKPLSPYLKNCRAFSGATITGEGRVITVLDILGVAQVAQLSLTDADAARAAHDNAKIAAGGQRKMSVLLFHGSDAETFAAPQDQLQRLERINVADIQRVGAREFINYHGHSLRIVRLDHSLAVGAINPDRAEAYLLIPKAAPGAKPEGGLLVSQIIDAADVDVDLEPAALAGPGVLGTAVLSEQITTFIDLADLVAASVN